MWSSENVEDCLVVFNIAKDLGSLIFYSTTYLSQEHFGASLLS